MSKKVAKQRNFPLKLDFSIEKMHNSSMSTHATQKSAKKRTGRPHGSRLDHPLTLEVLRLNIAKNGDTTNCYAGVCCKNTFLAWKKSHPSTWETLRDSGLREHALQASLSCPAILEKAISRLREKLEHDELNGRDLLAVIEYFDKRRTK